MKSTQEQIKEIFNTHYPKYSDQLDFIDKLDCNNPNGMCRQFKTEDSNNYQYLTIPLPNLKAEYIFICKEPSSSWARKYKQEDLSEKVVDGQFMNFISGVIQNNKLNMMLLAFIKIFNNKTAYITDMSKCAMNTMKADQMGIKQNLMHRYVCCAFFLEWEFANCVKKNPKIFLVGTNLFINKWYKDKYKKTVNHELAFHQFLKDIVNINITLGDIYHIPHYANNIFCPENFLSLLEYESQNKVSANAIRKEIIDSLITLYEFFLSNYLFTEKYVRNINSTLKDLKTKSLQIKLSKSLLVLYLLYRNEFNSAKRNWENHKL